MYSTLQRNRLPGTLPALMGIGAVDPASQAISAGVSLASVALGSWLQNKKQNALAKTYSTSIVNELEPLLNANKNAYLAGPGTCLDQAVALTAFDSAMQWLQTPQACGNIQLGTAGQNCINDRMPGGKWDWSAMYRNPIANDTRPVCDNAANAAGQAAVQNLLNKISGSTIQTEAGQYGATGSSIGNNGPLISGSVAGIPVEYLLMGAGAVLLIVLLS